MPRIRSVSHQVGSAPRRSLRPRKFEIDPTVSTHFQDTVMAIPELRALIALYLTRKDLRSLATVSRTWFKYWIPTVYDSIVLSRYRRTSVYPKIDLYGHLLTTLDVSFARWSPVMHLLHYTPNLLHLRLSYVTMSYAQAYQALALVPQLRSFSYQSRYKDYVDEQRWIVLVSRLAELEELVWSSPSRWVLIDDLLLILKSCKKLTRLRVEGARIVDNIPNEDPTSLASATTSEDDSAEPETAKVQGSSEMTEVGNHSDSVESDGEDNTTDMLEDDIPDAPEKWCEDDADPWTTTALKSLEFSSMVLGSNSVRSQSTSAAETSDNNSRNTIMRRLMRRVPNLKKIVVWFQNNFVPQDWEEMFKNQPAVEHVAIRSSYRDSQTGAQIVALRVLVENCERVRTLDIAGITGSGVELIRTFVTKNQQHLENLNAKRADVDDVVLSILAQGIDKGLYVTSPRLNDSLQELDLEQCRRITCGGLLKILECCTSLRVLNARYTSAGTIELFSGNHPWACAKSLQKLEIDIKFPSVSADFESALQRAPAPTMRQYTDAEQIRIRERLFTLTGLLHLDLRGPGLTFKMVDELSFAPRLQKFVIHVPFDESPPVYRGYKVAGQVAMDWSKTRFAEPWKAHCAASHYSGYLCSVVHATLQDGSRSY
ncbi:hypothetical protein BG004_006110 [Podila humilis]|nr:hypothetical protein BG004_006110 [Podila humilis]